MSWLIDVLQGWSEWKEAVAAVLALALLALALFNRNSARAGIQAPAAFQILSLGIVAALATCALIYLFTPLYLDHSEPNIAVDAVAVLRGQALYYDTETHAPLITQGYGPLLYLTNAAAVALSPSILGTKLAGVAAFGGALAAAGYAYAGRSSWGAVSLWIGVVAIVLAGNMTHVFWNRPEPFLMLCVALALVAAVRLRGFWGALAIGAAAGAASGFKIHGGIYVLPVAVWYITAMSPRARLAGAALVCIAGLALLLAPFAFPQILLPAYARLLMLVTHHRLVPEEFWPSAFFAIAFATPALYVLVRRRAHDVPILMLAGALVVCLAMATVLASKEGAGSHHLLPFVFVSVFLAMQTQRAGREQTSSSATPALIAFLVACAAFAWPTISGARTVVDLALDTQSAAQLAEVREIAVRYPDAVMAAGDDATYEATYFRTEMVLKGTPIIVETPSWMDLVAAGEPASEVEKSLKGCRVQAWVVPVGGSAFGKLNYYSGQRLASEAFVRNFASRYERVLEGAHYDVFACRSPGL